MGLMTATTMMVASERAGVADDPDQPLGGGAVVRIAEPVHCSGTATSAQSPRAPLAAPKVANFKLAFSRRGRQERRPGGLLSRIRRLRPVPRTMASCGGFSFSQSGRPRLGDVHEQQAPRPRARRRDLNEARMAYNHASRELGLAADSPRRARRRTARRGRRRRARPRQPRPRFELALPRRNHWRSAPPARSRVAPPARSRSARRTRPRPAAGRPRRKNLFVEARAERRAAR